MLLIPLTLSFIGLIDFSTTLTASPALVVSKIVPSALISDINQSVLMADSPSTLIKGTLRLCFPTIFMWDIVVVRSVWISFLSYLVIATDSKGLNTEIRYGILLTNIKSTNIV